MTFPNVDQLLEDTGFNEEESILTRRQAEVLALRERNVPQATIAEYLGTSRANVSSIEASARENIRKANETIAFFETLAAPVTLSIEAGNDLYNVPDKVYSACDDADVKVPHTAPELMKIISEKANNAVVGREIQENLKISVSTDGTVRVR